MKKGIVQSLSLSFFFLIFSNYFDFLTSIFTLSLITFKFSTTVFKFSFSLFTLNKRLKTSGCLIESFIKKSVWASIFLPSKRASQVMLKNSKYHSLDYCIWSSHEYLFQNKKIHEFLALVEETSIKLSNIFIF